MADGVGIGPTSPGGGSHESGGEQSNVREHDRYLPIANISRIMKKALPSNGKIAKEAKDTLQECVSEFISFVTSEASAKCQKEKRKTINGDDLLWAMSTLGFDDYIEPLKLYITRYRESEGDAKGSARGCEGSIQRDAVVVYAAQDPQFPIQGSLNYINSQSIWPRAKRIRVELGPSVPGPSSGQDTRTLVVTGGVGLGSVSG